MNKPIQVGFTGFVIALIGVIAGFTGFHIEERWLSICGFVMTVIGVSIVFIAIIYGWITQGKQAITGSIDATRDLQSKLKQFFKTPS